MLTIAHRNKIQIRNHSFMNTVPVVENRIWQPEFECMERSKLEALQVSRLKEAVARCATLPFYKEKFKEQGITPDSINSLADLRKLPFTLKSDLRDNYPLGFLAIPKSQVSRYQ